MVHFVFVGNRNMEQKCGTKFSVDINKSRDSCMPLVGAY